MTRQKYLPRRPAGSTRADDRGWRGRAASAGLVLVPLTGLLAGAAFASSIADPAPTAGPAAGPAAGPRVAVVSHATSEEDQTSSLSAQRKQHQESGRRQLRAFAAAGYDENDAADLARLWRVNSPYRAKVLGGRRLMAHRPMPIPPSQEPAVYWQKHLVLDQQPVADVFFGAGYDYDDAVVLALYWNTDSPYDAKVLAGRKLIQHVPLPIEPGGQLTAQQRKDADEARDLDAYFSAGYDYDDAVVLALYWNSADAYDAKVRAGDKLLQDVTLPIEPGGQLTAQQRQDAEEALDLGAFFDAGYDSYDADVLAQLWSLPAQYDAKIMAGRKLLDGLTLPVQPGVR